MFNPGMIFEIQRKWQRFTENHPKFPLFLRAVGNTKMESGTIIEISITTSEGQNISSNVKLNQEDVDMIHELGEMMRNAR